MPAKVLLVTTNGTGMGHLARMAAVALAGREQLDTTILTFSVAAGLTHDLSIPVEYCPSRERGWHSVWHWDSYMEARLCALINELQARVVVFDGVMPYDGLLRARARNPHVAFVWSRRGMWRPGANRRALRRGKYFDLILEPADIAGADDAGATVGRSDAQHIPPITLLTEVRSSSRDEARGALGLPADAQLLYFAAGSIRGTSAALLDHVEQLAHDHGWTVVTAAASPQPARPGRVAFARQFPLVSELRAFDAAVCATGYNAVHELVAAGIPTLLLPDSTVPTDDQALRARTAARMGYALTADPADQSAVRTAVTQLFSGWQPAQVTDSLDGATVAAKAIAGLAERTATATAKPRVPAMLGLRLKQVLGEALGPLIGAAARKALGRRPIASPRGRLRLGLGADAWQVQWTDDVRSVANVGAKTVVEHVLPATSAVYAQARRRIAEEYYLSRM